MKKVYNSVLFYVFIIHFYYVPYLLLGSFFNGPKNDKTYLVAVNYSRLFVGVRFSQTSVCSWPVFFVFQATDTLVAALSFLLITLANDSHAQVHALLLFISQLFISHFHTTTSSFNDLYDWVVVGGGGVCYRGFSGLYTFDRGISPKVLWNFGA